MMKPLDAVRTAAVAMGIEHPDDIIGCNVTIEESLHGMAERILQAYDLVEAAKSLLQNYGSAKNIPREVLQEVAKHGSDDAEVMAVCMHLEQLTHVARSLLQTYGSADDIPKAALQKIALELGIEARLVMCYCRRAEYQQKDKGPWRHRKPEWDCGYWSYHAVFSRLSGCWAGAPG